mmetsp:Transcript_32067/g.42290  ORF Transcript_32067/g.42290 Transcript_32067/m.42290 type:complete len:138 (+) Transcript_32067:1515-1928(+)
MLGLWHIQYSGQCFLPITLPNWRTHLASGSLEFCQEPLFFFAGAIALLQYPLSEYASGDCHITHENGCDDGNWDIINLVQLGTLMALFLLPILDYWEIIEAKQMEIETRSHNRYESYSSITTLPGRKRTDIQVQRLL